MADIRKIEIAVSNLEKQFGQGVVMQLGKNNAKPISVIPTGIISIDRATGIGGFPRGRIIEIYGPESSGKTTVSLQAIAQAQAAGGAAAFIDAEHALDLKYAAKLGVKEKELFVSQPDYGEQALEVTEALIRTGEFDILVVDSVAALVPKAELDGEMGDAQMGLMARLMSQAMRKLTGTVSKTKTCLIFINQIRDKIGVVFGNPETTTGGRALKFYASQRVDVRRIGMLKDGDQTYGAATKIKFVKNKLASPFAECEVDMIFGRGLSQVADLLNVAVEIGIVEKSGAWYSYNGERLGQGKPNAIENLSSNPEWAGKLFAAVNEKIKAAQG